MTSDHDTALGELVYETAVRLWRDATAAQASGLPRVTDEQLADVTASDLEDVRRWLDDFEGERLTLGRDGDTRTVKGLVDPAT
jgi:hypothetical protein